MKSFDDEVHRVLKVINKRTEERNMVKFGKWTLRINDRVMDRPFREAVRLIDAMDNENNAYLIRTLIITI